MSVFIHRMRLVLFAEDEDDEEFVPQTLFHFEVSSSLTRGSAVTLHSDILRLRA